METLTNLISIYMKSAIKSVENNVGATTTMTFIMTERHRAHCDAQIEVQADLLCQ